MKADRPFFDSNVLLYLLSADNRKANQAEAIIAAENNAKTQL